jgi:hypothetical protein
VTTYRPDTAFTLSPGKRKRPREHDDGHLRFIRTLPCLITGTRPVEACHIRYADPRYGKRETGMSEKPSDKYVVPLSPEKHREQHSMNEREFWEKHRIDPLAVATALWANTGDDEACEMILQEFPSCLRARLRQIDDEFRPAPSEGMVEALREARDALKWFDDSENETLDALLAKIDAALSASPTEDKP